MSMSQLEKVCMGCMAPDNTIRKQAETVFNRMRKCLRANGARAPACLR